MPETAVHTNRARVVTWEGIETLAVSEVDAPEAGDTDIIIDVGACGICGSDVHSYVEGAWIAAGVRMGHEFAGTVRALGSAVDGLVVGDRVAVNPAVPCQQCARCREGLFNLCGAMRGASGGFADQVTLSGARVGSQVFLLPDSMSFATAAFLEPLSVATRAVRMAAPPLDAPILVLGLGTIAQCVLQVLLAHGATDVIAVDVSERRREVARAAGAHEVIDPMADDLLATLLDSRGTLNSPYQVSGAIGAVFECSGSVAVLPAALELARAGAPISLIALASRHAELDLNMAVQKELRLLGSFAYTPQDCQQAFQLLASSRVDVAGLVSHTYPLRDITAAFETQRNAAESVKVMITP